MFSFKLRKQFYFHFDLNTKIIIVKTYLEHFVN